MNTPDLSALPSPCFLINEAKLTHNLRILQQVQEQSGARILLALKGFAPFKLFPLIRQYLAGTTASGLHEALLGHQEFGGEVHVYSPAYSEAEFRQLLDIAHHISFNSYTQKERLWPIAQAHPRFGDIAFGLRVNPGYSEVATEIYNPCAPGSRLGLPWQQFDPHRMDGLTGLHFHTLCQQGAETLARTLTIFQERFAEHLPAMQWVNFGGGHHITQADYNRPLLTQLIQEFREKYSVEVILEPGEAIAIHTGILVSTVLDIMHNQDSHIAILDTSATAHMPDILEMPYRPDILGADLPHTHPHTYRLGGMTCLAGDIMGDYSFPQPLQIGDKIIFDDMSHYTMVKTTTFNGIPLPAIALLKSDHSIELLKTFGYPDYKSRLS